MLFAILDDKRKQTLFTNVENVKLGKQSSLIS